MGRKIPGKKHRGVKDPEEQRKAREDKVKKQVSVAFRLCKCNCNNLPFLMTSSSGECRP